MKASSARLSTLFSATTLGCLLTLSGVSFGQDQTTTPDNTAQNKAHATTADQQSEASPDRLLTQKIRKAIMADKSLSIYGHNVKIITKDGAVTLKGPVPSDDEKQKIGSLAADAAGSADKITNQLMVKQ